MDLEYISLHDTSGIHLQEYIGKTQKCMHAQKYLASGKEYIDPHKTQDRALSHWSGSTESKTLDYQRTNPAATAAKSLQSCPTLCDPIDGSPPDSPVPGILQARTLECCHFLLQCMKVKSESEVA